MIAAARRPFREHGYLGTAMSDVVAESGVPRGSLYFHFRGGKEELATEVALHHAVDCIAHISAAHTARVVEKNLPPEYAHDLAGLAVTTVQGASS
jgi:AcrR family transcriptional regulator